MAKAVIVGNSPYITDYYRKNAKALFDETGGNSGNLAFNYAVANHIQAPQFAHWALPPADLRAKGDVVVLPLANQLGKHTDLGQAASRLSDIDLPIIGIGLGAQTGLNDADIELSDGTRLWLETIVKRAPSSEPNIGVRGAYTQKQIARLGYGSAVTVTGCPSNFINLHDDIGELVENGFKKKPRRIAVAAGIPYIPVLAGIERQLADIVTITGGSYIVQHGLQMLQLARNEFDQIGETTLEDYRRYIMPLRTVDEFKSWCRQYACAFYDVRAWMDHLRGFDFVIGTRFHGAMLAIQAGVPAACIAHDSRTEEMCKTMRIPVCRNTDIQGALTQHNIFDYFSFDAEDYRTARTALSKQYVRILTAAGITPSPALAKFSQSEII